MEGREETDGFSDEFKDNFEVQEFKEKKKPPNLSDAFGYSIMASALTLPLLYIKTAQIYNYKLKLFPSQIIQSALPSYSIFLRGFDSHLGSKFVSGYLDYIAFKSIKERTSKLRAENRNLEVFGFILLTQFVTGILHGIFCNPFEIVLVRQQAGLIEGGLGKGLGIITREGGRDKLLRGAATSSIYKACGKSVSLAVSLFNYEQGRYFPVLKSGVYTCVALSILYPLEYLRIRMQLSDVNKSASYIEIYREVVTKQGYRGLYKGFMITCVHRLIHSSIYYVLLNAS